MDSRVCAAQKSSFLHAMMYSSVCPRMYHSLTAFSQTSTAMQDAFAKDSRIHRDISLGNIILVNVPGRSARRGYLIDWEASCTVDDVGAALEVGRAVSNHVTSFSLPLKVLQGTWRFMSMRMLNFDGDKLKHTLQDDMEALFYVVLFCALMYQGHNCSSSQIRNILKNFFDEKMPFKPGIVRGGAGKRVNSSCRVFTAAIQFQSAELGEWINTVTDFFHPVYPSGSSSEENSTADESTESSIVDEPKDVPLDRWSEPKHLDVYWATFLKNHTLQQDNRSEYKLASQLEDETPSPVIFPTPPSPPRSSSNRSGRTLRKRSLPASNDDARGTKRTRRSGNGAPGSSGTRHSARLEEKTKREARERELEKKRKAKEVTKRGQAVQDKSKNTILGLKRGVSTARGGAASQPTKRSSTQKHRTVPGS